MFNGPKNTDLRWQATIFAENAEEVSLTASIPLTISKGKYGNSTEASFDLELDDDDLDGAESFMTGTVSLWDGLSTACQQYDPDRTKEHAVIARAMKTIIDFVKDSEDGILTEDFTQRCCLKCDHEYDGDIECPKCNEPWGEPIAAGFHVMTVRIPNTTQEGKDNESHEDQA